MFVVLLHASVCRVVCACACVYVQGHTDLFLFHLFLVWSAIQHGRYIADKRLSYLTLLQTKDLTCKNDAIRFSAQIEGIFSCAGFLRLCVCVCVCWCTWRKYQLPFSSFRKSPVNMSNLHLLNTTNINTTCRQVQTGQRQRHLYSVCVLHVLELVKF